MVKDRDYTTPAAGGVLQRFQSLMDKKHAGTLLISPFEVTAQARGFNVLGSGIDVLGKYQGLVGGARKSWAEANRDSVVAYIAAFSQAVDWLYDPANKEEAIGIFLKNQNNATRQAAETSYGVLLSPKEGVSEKSPNRHGRGSHSAAAALQIWPAQKDLDRPHALLRREFSHRSHETRPLKPAPLP